MTVTVLMITYNHEKYIAQAIESVLMQITNYNVELIIGDDNSSDATQEIIQQFCEKYSNTIIPILREENIGANYNYIDIFHKANGDYIANLEGDDYWTDPHKLQKQVDFLENNPDYILCFHNATFLSEKESEKTGIRLNPSLNEYSLDTKDLFNLNRVSTLTVMFRNNKINKLPDWYTKAATGDWPLWVLLSQYGKLKYMPFTGAVYRLHDESITAQKRSDNKHKRLYSILNFSSSKMEVCEKFLEIFPQHLAIIKTEMNRNSAQVFNINFALKRFAAAKTMIKKKQVKWEMMISFKDKIKYILVKFFITSGYE